MWEAFIHLIDNLASAPQILAVLLLEGTRVVYGRQFFKKPSGPQPKLRPFEFFLEVWRSGLNAAPSIGLVVSIFFVEF